MVSGHFSNASGSHRYQILCLLLTHLLYRFPSLLKKKNPDGWNTYIEKDIKYNYATLEFLKKLLLSCCWLLLKFPGPDLTGHPLPVAGFYWDRLQSTGMSGAKTEQDPVGPSWGQKPLYVLSFLFVEKDFSFIGLP